MPFLLSLYCDEKIEFDEAHIWKIPLNGTSYDMNSLLACLDQEEQARAQRFYFLQHQQQFVISHGCLRHILSHYIKLSPAELQFSTTEKGKPFCVDSLLQFSLSHTQDYALLAISHTPLGVDVEKIEPQRAELSIAKRFFAEEEYQHLATLPEPERIQAFFSVWTRKEAFVKALGLGLSYPLNAFAVNTAKAAAANFLRLSTEDDARWLLWDIAVPIEYRAALVTTTTVKDCKILRLPQDKLLVS